MDIADAYGSVVVTVRLMQTTTLSFEIALSPRPGISSIQVDSLGQCFSTFFASRTTLCNKKILGNTKQNFIITIMMFSSVLALLIY